MIELATETVVALGQATKHFPTRRGGKRPHSSTLYRWAKHVGLISTASLNGVGRKHD